jgi:hypothetical protein
VHLVGFITRTESVFRFSLQHLSETLLILRIIQRYTTRITNVHMSSFEVPSFMSDFNETWISRHNFEPYNLPQYKFVANIISHFTFRCDYHTVRSKVTSLSWSGEIRLGNTTSRNYLFLTSVKMRNTSCWLQLFKYNSREANMILTLSQLCWWRLKPSATLSHVDTSPYPHLTPV